MNSRRASAFFWIFFLFLVQNGAQTLFQRNAPPFVWIGVVFYALSEGPPFGFFIGCYAGFLLEIFAVGKMGTQIMTLGAVGAVSGIASSKIFGDSLATQLLLPAAAYCLSLAVHPQAWREAVTLPQIGFTLFFSPLVFWFLRQCARFS